jgi:hypothetical protein
VVHLDGARCVPDRDWASAVGEGGKGPAYGWFYNWMASARRRTGLRYFIIALWIVIPIEQIGIATNRT